MAIEVAQRSRGGGGGGGNPLGGGHAAQSHGEEIVVIFFFMGQPTQHPPPVSLPSPTQLASPVVDVQCHHLSSSFSSSSRFVAASKLHVALLVESDFWHRSAQGTPRSSSTTPPSRAPIIILPHPNPLGNVDEPGSKYDSRILTN